MSKVTVEAGWTGYSKTVVVPEVFSALDRLLRLPTGLFQGEGSAIRRGAEEIAVNWSELGRTHIHDSTWLPAILVFASLDPEATAQCLLSKKDRFFAAVSKIGSCDSREIAIVAALGGEDIDLASYQPDRARFTENLVAMISAVDAWTLFDTRRQITSHYDIEPNLERFKAAGKSLSFPNRLIVGSIYALYNGYDANRNLTNRGTTWNPDVATAVGEIREQAEPEITSLWFRTIASYPGW